MTHEGSPLTTEQAKRVAAALDLQPGSELEAAAARVIDALVKENEIMRSALLSAAEEIQKPQPGAAGIAQAWREAAGVYE